uniref:ubiquitinyl hydrolase 1 n=1 Tax=Mesocestoides corti TaxID=53468 RepID=A0A5K3FTL0_MESCO
MPHIVRVHSCFLWFFYLVLSLLLRENLHQPQYVERVTWVVQFLIETGELSLEDLDEIWEAQVGKHEAIVKNVEDMLATLVRSFTPEQLDRLFDCFKRAFKTTSKRQRERLIDLIRRLTVDGHPELALKALDFLWDLAIRPSFFAEIAVPALNAHKDILSNSFTCTHSDDQALLWLHKLSKVLKDDSNDYAVVCAARQIISICSKFKPCWYAYESSPIYQLAVNEDLVPVCITSLINYMAKFSPKDSKVTQDLGIDSTSSQPPSATSTLSRGDMNSTTSSASNHTLEQTRTSDDGIVSQSGKPVSSRHFPPIPHSVQIEDRLTLLRFLATEAGVPLTLEQLDQLWQCLIVDAEDDRDTAISSSDASDTGDSTSSTAPDSRNVCFTWFDPTLNELVQQHAAEFFKKNILKIEPEALTPTGMKLFRCFFNYVNCELGKIDEVRLPRQHIVLRDPDLVGVDYLWRLVLAADERVARIGIEMLQELYTNLDNSLLNGQRNLHLAFIKKCFNFLSTSYQHVHKVLLTHGETSADGSVCHLSSCAHPKIVPTCLADTEQDLRNLDRVLQVLRRFLVECDLQFQVPQNHLPLFQSWCGSSLTLHVTFGTVVKASPVDKLLQSLGVSDGRRYAPTTLTIVTHANETLGHLRSRLLDIHLSQLLDSSVHPTSSAGGDEAPTASLAALNQFGLELLEMTGLPGNLCLSTYLILASSDPSGEELTGSSYLDGDESDSSFSTSGGAVGKFKPAITLTARLYLRDANPPDASLSGGFCARSNVDRLQQHKIHFPLSSSVENSSVSSSNPGPPPPRGSLSSHSCSYDDDDQSNPQNTVPDENSSFPGFYSPHSSSAGSAHSPDGVIGPSSPPPAEAQRNSKRHRCRSAAVSRGPAAGNGFPVRSASANKFPVTAVGTNPSSTAGGDCATVVSPAALVEPTECNLPGYMISGDLSFVRLLFDISDLAVFLGIQQLRDMALDVLFSIPVSLHHQKLLRNALETKEGFGQFSGLFKCSPSELIMSSTPNQAPNGFELASFTQQLYFLQVLYSILHPSMEPYFSDKPDLEFLVDVSAEAFCPMLAFLRNGGLSVLLSAPVFDFPLDDPLYHLIVLWICRIASLCLNCTLASLVAVCNDNSLCSQRLAAFWQMEHTSPLAAEEYLVHRRAGAFAEYACLASVTKEEILSVWLQIPPMSAERLRNVCWLASSASLGHASGTPATAASIQPHEMHAAVVEAAQEAAASAMCVQRRPATLHSHDSGCASPLADTSCQSAPPSVTCTFSTTCGLQSAALQAFLQSGRVHPSLHSPGCLRLLLPKGVPCHALPPHAPSILALQSGRTPGCLSLDALETLCLLLTLAPDAPLRSLLAPNQVVSSSDHEVLPPWLSFLHDLLILSPSKILRQVARSRVTTVVTRGLAVASSLIAEPLDVSLSIWNVDAIECVIHSLVEALEVNESDRNAHTTDCTDVLIQLLKFSHSELLPLGSAEALFRKEWTWLSNKISTPGEGAPESDGVSTPAHLAIPSLVCSHLRLCTALLPFQNEAVFSESAVEPIGLAPIKALLEVVMFPASKRFAELRKAAASTAVDKTQTVSANALLAVGRVLATCPDNVLAAAFNLLLELVYCAPRVYLPFLADHLSSLLFCPELRRPLTDWEASDIASSNFRSSVDSRQRHSDLLNSSGSGGDLGGAGFVGLKNAGATCYMNSVLQQLFSILPVRFAVLSAPVTEALEKAGIDPSTLTVPSTFGHQSSSSTWPPKSSLNESQLSHLCVLHSLQDMFAFLAYSKRKFYEPKQFWRHFKLGGERVNCSEQHDAQEFFSSLVDNVDEAMKLCGVPKAIENVIGGAFEDQKICIDCPHRYQREESFLAVSVDVNNNSTLCESLEEYVKSDLLDGDNAYHCDQCDKKVAVRKRMCIKRLPHILTIHLKRFNYDWERHTAIKSNSYFSFPRELDMAPYTVEGLASRDVVVEDAGSLASASASAEDTASHASPVPPAQPNSASKQPTRYTLRGVVVHYGQASAGHYYSYILHKRPDTGTYQWYKYDDTHVTAVHMDSSSLERNEWFGGEYTSPYSLHTSIGPTMRCWSAYMLFYEREDFQVNFSIADICRSMESVVLSE